MANVSVNETASTEIQEISLRPGLEVAVAYLIKSASGKVLAAKQLRTAWAAGAPIYDENDVQVAASAAAGIASDVTSLVSRIETAITNGVSAGKIGI